MNLEDKIEDLVVLQAAKIKEEFTIMDFAKMTVEAADEGKFICKEAADEFIKNLECYYNEFIIAIAKDKVLELFSKHAKDIIKKRKEPEIRILEELEDIEPLEKEEGESDLKYVITNDIYIKNVNIYNQERFPESETENYWMIGVDINKLSEEELQSLSIFDRDFW